MSEHLGISSKTGKTVKTMHQTTAIYDHFFDIVIMLTLMESLIIERDRPILNKSTKSMPLELFLMFVTSFLLFHYN